MARLSALTNPTSLKEISRKDVALVSVLVGERRHVAISRLDFAEYGVPEASPIILVARAGTTSSRFDVGTVGKWSREPFSLGDLDPSAGIRFRLLVRDASSSKFLASAENLRLAGDGESESLLPIEVVDLGQMLWKVSIDDDGPTLYCNERVFPSGPSAEGYTPFNALVLPEALRCIMRFIANEPAKLAEEGSPWEPWAAWIEILGVEPNPRSDDDADKTEWIETAVEKFCETHRFADQMQSYFEKAQLK